MPQKHFFTAFLTGETTAKNGVLLKKKYNQFTSFPEKRNTLSHISYPNLEKISSHETLLLPSIQISGFLS